jgi:hypothetical protein
MKRNYWMKHAGGHEKFDMSVTVNKDGEFRGMLPSKVIEYLKYRGVILPYDFSKGEGLVSAKSMADFDKSVEALLKDAESEVLKSSEKVFRYRLDINISYAKNGKLVAPHCVSPNWSWKKCKNPELGNHNENRLNFEVVYAYKDVWVNKLGVEKVSYRPVEELEKHVENANLDNDFVFLSKIMIHPQQWADINHKGYQDAPANEKYAKFFANLYRTFCTAEEFLNPMYGEGKDHGVLDAAIEKFDKMMAVL